ncbi:MAG: cell division protein FtsQ/DivIB [Rubrivivax sp.]|nr:cell division protein FtsQ/DivIB [Rubrivivax sp.]
MAQAAVIARPVAPRAAPPGDVRLMNGVSLAVGVVALGVLLTAAGLWLVRAPWFALRAIQIEGDTQRNSAATLRANTVPRLSGTFFTLDLQQARQVFESVPWVRQAVVRRVWPNRLAVRLEEHRPAARWLGHDGNERWVNTYGEVFEAPASEAESEQLPLLAGPDGSSARLLAMHQRLETVFARLGQRVAVLEQSGRGSWSLTLSDESEVVIGRGDEAEIVARATRFAATLTQVLQYHKTDLLSADLRHPGGYAVRLKGATTVPPEAARGRKN